jgi:hypothetical protein
MKLGKSNFLPRGKITVTLESLDFLARLFCVWKWNQELVFFFACVHMKLFILVCALVYPMVRVFVYLK